jgi:hypothetical protein
LLKAIGPHKVGGTFNVVGVNDVHDGDSRSSSVNIDPALSRSTRRPQKVTSLRLRASQKAGRALYHIASKLRVNFIFPNVA